MNYLCGYDDYDEDLRYALCSMRMAERLMCTVHKLDELDFDHWFNHLIDDLGETLYIVED